MTPSETRLFEAEGGQVLQDQIEVFASHWIKGWRSHTSLPGELAAFHSLTTAALARATEKWNYDRNSLRVLPAETLEHCWSFLDTPDLVRAARVCRAWKKTLYSTPALWTDITFYGRVTRSFKPLGVLLGLSKERMLRVFISAVSSDEQYNGMREALRSHSHRIYQLDLQNLTAQNEYYSHDQTKFLGFVAPELRSFTCRNSTVQMIIQGCPKLQFLSVNSIGRWWHSQPNVTSLEFRPSWGDSDRLYEIFPSLVRLKLTGTDPYRHRLELPKGSIPDSLQHVILHGFDVSYEALCEFGLTNIRELEYQGNTLDDTLVLFARLGATPRSAEISETYHTIVADAQVASGQPARTVRISFPVPRPDRYSCILHLASVSENITSLTILPYGLWDEEEERFILPKDQFPALKTLELVLSAATGEKFPSHAQLNLEVMPRSGCLRAPALRRLAISRFTDDRGFERRYHVEPIHPLAIVVFLTRHVELAPGRQIEELALDGENGIQLCEMDKYNDSLQILESYVGKITYFCKEAPSTMG